MSSTYQPATARGRHVRAAVRHSATDTPKPRPHLQGHMAPTSGERRTDCASYGTCLLAHVRAHPRADPPASCPTGCRWFAGTVEHATDFAYAPGGGALAQIGRERPW